MNVTLVHPSVTSALASVTSAMASVTIVFLSKVKATSEEIGCPQNKFLIVGNKNLKLIALVRITIE